MGRRIKFAVLLFYFTRLCISQNYNTKLFFRNEGLTDPYVYSVVQDKAGYLWVFTGKGLVRFDGQFFNKINTDSLKEEIIYASAIEKPGTLWFGTSGGKLVSWDPLTKRLKHFSKEMKASVQRILSSEHGDYLFISTMGNCIFAKRGEDLLKIEGSADFQLSSFIELDVNHLFYLFSDGYADQFSGEKGKKLMLKDFKKILISIAETDLNKQGKKFETRL